MDPSSQQQKLQQFHEFFTIKHRLMVNVVPLDSDYILPELSELDNIMPDAFRIASEVATVESKALRPLRMLGDHAADLVEFLNYQSRKIDLIMSYVLRQQDKEEHQGQAIEFGGGGVVIAAQAPMPLGQNVELKIFINEEATAVYCFAEVIACEADQDNYNISLLFTRIREQDQELLVRASLHLQTRQLKKRAQEREQNQ